MIKRFVPTLCLLLALCACSLPATAGTLAPSLTPAPPVTAGTLAPSLTPPPSANPPPSSTPLGWVPPATTNPTFTPHGPFLVFADHLIRPSKIALYDPLQHSQLELEQPAGDVLDWHSEYLSPDGQYLAYYTGGGKAPNDLSAPSPDPQHVELNIQRSADGSVVFRTELLNPDYPHNFLAAADNLLAHPPADLDSRGASRDDLANGLWHTFLDQLSTNSWSNHGHILAFASGAGGPSSDVYTYDVDTSVLTRITDGPSEVYQIIWSPDDSWILNSGVYWEGEGMCGTWYVSTHDGRSSYPFQAGGVGGTGPVRGCNFDGWANDGQALVSESANGRGIYNLELMDLRQHTINLLWPHTFTSFAYDPDTQQVYVATDGEQQASGSFFPQGTYRVDAATYQSESVAQEMSSLTYLGWPNQESIVGLNPATGNTCFLPSTSCAGVPYSSAKANVRLSVSSDRKYLVVDTSNGLWLVTPAASGLNQVTQVSAVAVDNLIWSYNPGADPANDWLLLNNLGSGIPNSLYHPTTGEQTRLTGFDDFYAIGWGWR